jgi:Bacterial Ig-like domain (group 3)
MLPLPAILRFMRVDLVSLKTIERLGRLSGPAAMGFALAAVVGVTAGTALGQTRIATTATLSVTSGGGAVTTVASGSVVTLTATVNAGGIPVTPGQVNFCDASAAFCTDIHLLGTAQLTGAGTAIMKFRPGLGTHSYKAVFPGTNSDAGSSSGASALTVTGTPYPLGSATTIAETGGWGNYALTA